MASNELMTRSMREPYSNEVQNGHGAAAADDQLGIVT